MVTDTARLRATVFEQTGIAIDEKDPIIAVLVATAQQAEEVGARLLRRVSPVRIVIASAASAAVFGAAASWGTWEVAQAQARTERAEWLRQQANPQTAALIRSEQGRAGLQLAELGVAKLLVRCDGRRSWRIVDEYCIPSRPDGTPDGFRVVKGWNRQIAEGKK